MKALPLALGCLLLAVPSSARAQGVACGIVSVEGSGAQVRRAGRAVPATGAMPLDPGDRVRTGDGDRVSILCDDGLRMTVGPRTTLDLGTMTGGEAGWAVVLLDGIAGFLRPLFGTGRFEVRTPSAVASVRSTGWIVTVEARATAVFVEDGAVAVAARTGGAVLTPGEGIDVGADGAVGPVRVWGAGRVRRTRERLGPRAE